MRKSISGVVAACLVLMCAEAAMAAPKAKKPAPKPGADVSSIAKKQVPKPGAGLSSIAKKQVPKPGAGLSSIAKKQVPKPGASVSSVAKKQVPKPVAGMSGIASVYNEKGTRSASGEIINPKNLTAAHRSLSFGTKVRVVNKRNGRSVVVRIIDRGPFIRGRVIDLSPAAARALGLGGLAPVTLAVLGNKV